MEYRYYIPAGLTEDLSCFHDPVMDESNLRQLSSQQYAAFWRDGYLVAPKAVSETMLNQLRELLAQWTEDSRSHPSSYGETIDGRPRFDVAPCHSADAPALRRVDNPSEIDGRFAAACFDSAMVDMAADLIGPDLKFHHSKINLKLPRTETRVDYHQDFSYTPHTNDHVVTALLMLDDMSEDNGCLMVVPGSHCEGQQTLWQGDRFTGKVNTETTNDALRRAVAITGSAGSVCLMHSKLLHGSEPNRGLHQRALMIAVYSAADAVPIAKSPLPNQFEGRIVRGRPTRMVRLDSGVIELPANYRAASFFEVQESN